MTSGRGTGPPGEAMRRRLLLALVMSSLSAGGCTAYRAAYLPGETSNNQARDDELWVGAAARVEYSDGRKYSGEITAVTDSTFTIGRAGNYGLEERTLTRAEITAVEMEDQADFSSNLLATMATLVALSAAFLVLLVTGYKSN